MTLYGWDASHYDGPLSRAILDRARAEGISFFTHKIAESLQDTEGTLDDTALAAARDAGMPFVGGYFVARTNATPAAQVAAWVRLLNAGEPWWRDFPGFFVQIDLERWPYDNVPASVGIECGHRLRDALDRVALLYASRGQYGDSLTAWDGPLWNANYSAGPAYPGDGWLPGWTPYSGRVPAILQYTSSATIAGLSTCDKNAFRGSLADFAAMIGGRQMGYLDDPNAAAEAWRVDALHQGTDTVQGGPTAGEPMWLVAEVKRIAAKLDQPTAVTLTDADRLAIAAQVTADLAAELVTVGAKLDQLLARLAAAGSALNG